MGLFSKKFDIEKDRLRIAFNSNIKQYEVFYGNQFIHYNSLSNKSKRLLLNKNKELLTNTELLIKELEQAKTSERFQKLKELGYSCHSFEYLGNITGTMSEKMEIYLNELVNEEDVLLGIHRVGKNITSESIDDILTNGLKITAHLGSGANTKPHLKDNVSYYANNKTIIKELIHANAYKDSIGSILIRIPDEDLTGNLFVVNELGETRLNPKYILGYVPIYPNNHIENIYQVNNENEKETIQNTL